MGLPACSLVSSTLAIPVVVFGAVSLIQQAKQAKEDKALRLKAINRHNTFLSQEDETQQPGAQSKNSAATTSSADDSFSSADDPDTAAPAMLDQPERPEPTTQAPDTGSSNPRAVRPKTSKLPPQTAVLDRPERPEPDTASSDANVTTHNDVSAPLLQPQASAASMIGAQVPTRPHSPATIQQVILSAISN